MSDVLVRLTCGQRDAGIADEAVLQAMRNAATTKEWARECRANAREHAADALAVETAGRLLAQVGMPVDEDVLMGKVADLHFCRDQARDMAKHYAAQHRLHMRTALALVHTPY